jgi:hypothetical protein
VARAVSGQQNAPRLHPIHEMVRRVRSGTTVRLEHLESKKQAGPAHIRDERDSLRQSPKTLFQIGADRRRLLLEALVANDVQHFKADGARHRIPTERVEILHAVVEGRGDRTRGDDCPDGESVSNGLAHGDDIRRDSLQLKRPEHVTGTTKPSLYLVGDADDSFGPGMSIRGAKPAVRRHDLPATTQNGLVKKRGSRTTRFAEPLRSQRHVLSIPVARVRPTFFTTERIRHTDHPHMRGHARPARTIELVRTRFNEGGQIAVIASLHHHQTPMPGGRGSQAQREVVCLRTAVREVAYVESIRKRRRETFCVTRQVRVQIPGVRVQHRQLPRSRAYDPGVRMPDMTDIVDTVQPGATVGIEEVHANPPHNV